MSDPPPLFGRDYVTVYHPTVDAQSGAVNGILFIGLHVEPILAAQAGATRTMLIAAFLLALVVTGAAAYAAKRLFRPLNQISHRVTALAENDLDTPIPHRERGDEIGDVARALEILRNNSATGAAIRKEREEAEARTQELRARRDAAIEDFPSQRRREAGRADRQYGEPARSAPRISRRLPPIPPKRSTTPPADRRKRPRMSVPSRARRRSFPPPSRRSPASWNGHARSWSRG